jgi:hypothetical protein
MIYLWHGSWHEMQVNLRCQLSTVNRSTCTDIQRVHPVPDEFDSRNA